MFNSNEFPTPHTTWFGRTDGESLNVLPIAAECSVQERHGLVPCRRLRPHFSLIFWQIAVFTIFFDSES
jgi:hypothetical protein